MTITGHTSGNLNDIRAYPLADDASRRADDGTVLPENLVNDCHIWWPDIYGETAFVASVTVSPALMTLTIATKNVSSGAVTLLAAVQIPRPATPYRSYPLETFQAGVGGWVAPGNIPGSMEGIYTWLFSTPEQSKLLARLARPYKTLPVTSLGEYGNDQELTGKVKFLAGRDLTIEEGYRYIDGVYTRCIVFALDEERLPDLYEYYAGPCGKRPESENCPKTPIRTINGVTPDCNGVVCIDIDEANGVLEGRGDITDGLSGSPNNAALYTPIEYDDVCATVDTFDPMPVDACESSLSAEPGEEEESSLPGPAGPAASSSSLVLMQEMLYNFDSPSDIYHFAAFSNAKEYECDYEIQGTPGGGEQRLMWRNGDLVIHVVDEKRNITRIKNAYYRGRLDQVGDWAEIEINLTVSRAEVLASQVMGADLHSARLDISIASEGLLGLSEATPYFERGIHAQLRFIHTTAIVSGETIDIARIDSVCEWFGGLNGGSLVWQTIKNKVGGGTMSATSLLYPVLCDAALPGSSSSVSSPYLSSLSLSSSSAALAESSSSARGPCFLELPDEIDVRVLLRVEVIDVPAEPQASSSSPGPSGYVFDVDMDVDVVQEGVDHRLVQDGDELSQQLRGELDPKNNYTYLDTTGDWSQLGLYETDLFREHDDVGTGPFHVVPFDVHDLALRSGTMLTMVCADADFEASPSRVSYQPRYTPDDGWSDDFAVERSWRQFQVLTSFVSPQRPTARADDAISLPYQYLDLSGGSNHKYARLLCQSTVADDYVYSAAFKAVGGTPKYGIMLGYQGGANNVFWAIVVDPANQQITYGVHYLGYFRAAGWSPLPPQPPSWQYEWHRLVVRIVGNGPYTAQAWVDPSGVALGSSSPNLTKTIPINYAGAQYTLTPLSEWDGDLSGLPWNEFADGPPGIYVFGGEARVAEFTVSPNNQDIVVPNKVSWLGDL